MMLVSDVMHNSTLDGWIGGVEQNQKTEGSKKET